MIAGSALLINLLTRLLTFLGINFADGSQGLLFVADLDAEFDGLFFENTQVKYDYEHLEWDLQAVYDPPPKCRLELIFLVWHADGGEKEHHCEYLHQDIGGRAEALVHEVGRDRVLQDAGSCAEEHAAGQAEEETAEAHNLKAHLK